jgi:hypothetical protein
LDADELSQEIISYRSPLSPLLRPDDLQRYLELDSGPLMYESFKKLLIDPAAVLSRGHLVIIDGGTGFGKTSLANLCAHWLREQLPQRHVAVSLIENEFVANDTDTRLKLVFLRLLDEVGHELHADVVTDLRGRENIGDAFASLGRRMADAAGKALIVLMPPGGTAEEVRQLAAAAGRGLVFFSELNDPGQARVCAEHFGKGKTVGEVAVLRLTLGALNQGDGKLLVESIHGEAAGFPPLSQSIIDRYFERSQNSPPSVRQLIVWARGAQHMAKENGRNEVGDADMLDFFTLMTSSAHGVLS